MNPNSQPAATLAGQPDSPRRRSRGTTFLLVVLVAALLFGALILVRLPILVAAVIVLVTSIWMAIDARSLGYEPSGVQGLAGMEPMGWFFAGLLVWIVALPLYVVKRRELKAAGDRSRAGDQPAGLEPPADDLRGDAQRPASRGDEAGAEPVDPAGR